MKLYSLKNDVGYLIGDGDQQVRCLLNRDDSRSFIQNDFPEFDRVLRFELHNKAELTNCVSQGGLASSGVLIDGKVKGIFDEHNLITHKYYPVEIIEENGTLITNDYYWIQLRQDLTGDIDYNNSIFSEINIASRIGEIKLESFNDYKSQREEKGWKWDAEAKELHLRMDSDVNKLDLFQLFPFDLTICISERLRNSLIDNNVSGFEINPYEKVLFP